MIPNDEITRLVITRRHGESVQIGDDVRVEFYFDPHRGRQARVVIYAPRSTKILRSELLDAQAAEA